MKNFKLLVLIFGCLLFYSKASASTSLLATPNKTAVEAIKALFPSLTKNSKLKTQKCSFQKEKWAGLILTKQSFEEKLLFNANCDLNGNFIVKMDKFFPINLKVKDQEEISKIISNIKMTVLFEEMPLFKIFMKDAIIIGSKKITFDMEYGVYIDPLNTNPLVKHKGGFILIKKHGEKHINRRYPLKLN